MGEPQREPGNINLAALRRVPLEIRTTRITLEAAMHELAGLDAAPPDERSRAVRRWCRKARRALDEAAITAERSRAALDESIRQAEAQAAELRREQERALDEIAASLDEADRMIRSFGEVA
jgi:predicted  nucleic acid-binding Zn-ribbon protein